MGGRWDPRSSGPRRPSSGNVHGETGAQGSPHKQRTRTRFSAQGPAGLLTPSGHGLHHWGKTGRPPTVRPGSGRDPEKGKTIEREAGSGREREENIKRNKRISHQMKI